MYPKTNTEKNMKIVIGANFGDEGKGLMTDYFCRKAAENNEKSLVICHNGGSQRGHTVVSQEGVRHVFHHFGSGSFAGADTYLSKDFIVNPMVFCREWKELEKIGYSPKVFVHPACRVTTPFDMIINQLMEEKRADQRHGSCGMGIFETICRCRHMEENGCNPSLKALYQDGKTILQQIQDVYFPQRLETLNLPMDKEWKAILSGDGLILHYLEDLAWMCQNLEFAELPCMDDYSTFVFEGGQGLLLDQGNQEYFPHLTPSNTGMKNPIKLLEEWAAQNPGIPPFQIEVCYVTRPYLTRHGAGRLDLECTREEIHPAITDLTNIPNPYQGTLRYGKMDVHALKKRILQDFALLQGIKSMKNPTCTLALTHRNECKEWFFTQENWDMQEFTSSFAQIYHSYQEEPSKTSVLVHSEK